MNALSDNSTEIVQISSASHITEIPVLRYDDNPEFNEYVDSDYGDMIEIAGCSLVPSQVLFYTDIEAYKTALQDFRAQIKDKLITTVTREFPSPIAYNFYRMMMGYENKLQRLHYMRDSWESLINLSFALAVCELVNGGHDTEVFHYRLSKLFSDSLSDRLDLINALAEHLERTGDSPTILPVQAIEAVHDMRQLNRIRNEFSHIGALSEVQADNQYAEHIDEVMLLFERMEGLKDVLLLQFTSHSRDPLAPRFEVFRGESTTRTYEHIPFTMDEHANASRQFRVGAVAAKITGKLASLSPMIICRPDSSGHNTKLYFYKRKRGSSPTWKFEYECFSDSEVIEVDQAECTDEIEIIRELVS